MIKAYGRNKKEIEYKQNNRKKFVFGHFADGDNGGYWRGCQINRGQGGGYKYHPSPILLGTSFWRWLLGSS